MGLTMSELRQEKFYHFADLITADLGKLQHETLRVLIEAHIAEVLKNFQTV
jgi:pyruvate-formate lyase-activating enzyme